MLALLAVAVWAAAEPASAPAPTAPPLPYRIVSFHGGRADKALIKRAHELGFNGVMIQTEEGTVPRLEEFAEYDRREQIVRYCHDLGMQVTVWVHELADIPAEVAEAGLTPDNAALWELLDRRYERFLGELLPQIDGLVLTVVETQARATDPAMLVRIVAILREKCHKYRKTLIVRTFVWTVAELEDVMAAVGKLPDDVIIMSKCVPQDWHLRSFDEPALGAVGAKQQIEEFDVAGEYFGRDKLTNCMPELLERQFRIGLRKGIDGVCVRVDRFGVSVLHEPMEVNLWTLGLLAAGKAMSAEQAWQAWAGHRYGPQAAPGVIRALRDTTTVVQETLYVDRLMFGNPRRPTPPPPTQPTFAHNADIWKWDAAYVPLYEAALAGDPKLIAKVEADKASALELAERHLDELEKAKADLPNVEYQILRHKLLTNKVQLQWRSRAQLAYLRYRRYLAAEPAEKPRLAAQIAEDLAAIRQAVANTAEPKTIEHLGRTWRAGPPVTERAIALDWADAMAHAVGP